MGKACSRYTKQGKRCRAPCVRGRKVCLFHSKTVRRAARGTGRAMKRGAKRYIADRTYRSMRKRWG